MPLWLNRSLSPWLTFLFKLQTLFHCWMLYNALLFFSIIAWSLLNFSFCYLYTSWFVKILHVIYTAEGTVHFPSLWMNWLRTLTSTFMPSVSCWNFLFIMPAIFTRCVFLVLRSFLEHSPCLYYAPCKLLIPKYCRCTWITPPPSVGVRSSNVRDSGIKLTSLYSASSLGCQPWHCPHLQLSAGRIIVQTDGRSTVS